MSASHSEKKTGRPVEPASAAGNDLQENLRRLDRLANLGLVSASLAHEIKNGLVAIKTYVEILLEKGEDREMAGVVQRELVRIDGLATQMLRLSAPKSKALAPVSIHHLLDLSLRLLEHQMSGRMIVLKRDYRAGSDLVRGDESQLQQAFMNLVLNGVEAIGSNGELTVRTETAPGGPGGNTLKIYFQDTGPGISPEHLSRLFEPFFTTKARGTGLGLATARRIIESHGGTLTLACPTTGGTVAAIRLPVNHTYN